MTDIDRYTPPSSTTKTESDITTWTEHDHDQDFQSSPECSAHHTYRETVALEEFEIWVCPSCGRFSDAYAPHSGGIHLTNPVNISASDAVIVTGHALIPPPEEWGDQFGDGSMDALLITSPYAAKEDIKEFKHDAEWPHPPRRYRRWVPEQNQWAVSRSLSGEFTDHMTERGWIVINLLSIGREKKIA